jgi:tyrosyl-DNA phosphodiesterase 2
VEARCGAGAERVMKPFTLQNGAWKEAAPSATTPRTDRSGFAGSRSTAEGQCEGSIDLVVATWNTWFGDHMFDERTTALLAHLAQRRPDVIALQEVTITLLERLLDEPWVRHAYAVSDLELWQRYDVILLARAPIRRLSQLELPTQMGRRLLVAELACNLTVATVHLESMKESTDARADQLRRIQPYLAQLGPDALLVGDMNFDPEARVENAALGRDLVDLWPALRPDDPGYTADSEANAMRYMLKPKLSQKRIDRAFLRGSGWRATRIELLGTSPIDDEGTFISDHFGLELALTAAA